MRHQTCRCGTRVPSVGLSAFAKEFVPITATTQPTTSAQGEAPVTHATAAAVQPQPQLQSSCPAPTAAATQGHSSDTPHQELPVGWGSTSAGQHWGYQGDQHQYADAWADDWACSAQDDTGVDVQGDTGDGDPYWAYGWWDAMGKGAYPYPDQQPQPPVHAPRNGDGGGGAAVRDRDGELGLPAAEALELLGLVFPHYSRSALQRLLSGFGGDLEAAYLELCVLERQHGAEAEAGAGGAEAAQGASTARKGPQAGVGVGSGRLEGGGGPAEFALDMEVSLPYVQQQRAAHNGCEMLAGSGITIWPCQWQRRAGELLHMPS